MIQPKRSNLSRSLLREAQYAVVVLDEAQKEDFFKTQIQKVVRNRKDPAVVFTGAKALKTQFLAALSQLGEVKTANIWARKLLIDLESIRQLQMIIEKTLREQHIYGITEIHLQDPEINSSHIQFVGIKAHEAESEIAKIVVALGYEFDIESAIGRKVFVQDAEILPEDFLMEEESISEPIEYEAPVSSVESLIEMKESLLNELDRHWKTAFKGISKTHKTDLRKLDNQSLKRYRGS